MKTINNPKLLNIRVQKELGDLFQTISIPNWSGKVFFGKKANHSFCDKIKSLSGTSIYLLINFYQNEKGTLQIYIGETDSFTQRIKRHSRSKEWWNTFIAFTSDNKTLTRAHAKYLEKILWSLLSQPNSKIELMNSSCPSGSKLPENDIIWLEDFLSHICFVLEALGDISFTEKDEIMKSKPQNKNPDTCSAEQQIKKEAIIYPTTNDPSVKGYIKSRGNYKKAILEKGSHINRFPSNSFKLAKKGRYYSRWQSIINSNKVKESNIKGFFITQEDVEFQSSTVAAMVATGYRRQKNILLKKTG